MEYLGKVGIVMGSKSDLEVAEKAAKLLTKFGVKAEMRVISAHRTPLEAHAFASKAIENGFEALIGVAGKAAHLAGVLAGYTTLPVIALPIKTGDLGGLDSLLSMVQMPSGVPVACVAINGGENAGLLAVQILAIKYPALAKKLAAYKQEMAAAVKADDEAVSAL